MYGSSPKRQASRKFEHEEPEVRRGKHDKGHRSQESPMSNDIEKRKYVGQNELSELNPIHLLNNGMRSELTQSVTAHAVMRHQRKAKPGDQGVILHGHE